jgi:hypothetical protein
LDESSAVPAEAVALCRLSVVLAMLKAGRKSGVVVSIRVNALAKEKDPPSESASDGTRREELLSGLKKSRRSVCCANEERPILRNPATAESARFIIRENSAKTP